MNHRILIATLTCLLTTSACYAQVVTNKISGVGPKSARINPYFCIQNKQGEMTYTLAPNATVETAPYSGNQYYTGATLRFGGCSENNTYLGYVGLSGTIGKVAYTPPLNVHISYVNGNIDRDGNITGNIEYTPIAANFDLSSDLVKKNKYWDFVGVNLSGLEFGKVIDPVVIPNLSVEDASSSRSDLAEMQGFIHAGMNSVRVPISWGYLQLDGPGVGTLNLGYYNSYIKPLLETLTANKVHTIVDLHAYMRYSKFGKEYSGCSGEGGQCPDGTMVLGSAAYKNVWTQLLLRMQKDAKIDMNYILLDLVNEPVDVPNDSVFTIQTDVIKALQSQGFKGLILVEGNHWSGLHSWTTRQWKSTDGSKVYTNATLFTRDNFVKAGVKDLSKIIINVHQYLDSDYSGTHDQCLSDLSSKGDNGFNLQEFADYLQKNQFKAMVTELGAGRDSRSCADSLTQFLQYLKDNSANGKEYGFVGWTLWSAGHGWGNYNLRVTPNSYHMDVADKFLQ